jgi:hypothetical protein
LHLNNKFGPQQYELWIKIFVNRWGIMDAYEQESKIGMTGKVLEGAMNNFIFGFNESTQWGIMIDVGEDRESMVTRIKGM